ncbi:hypothetical protein Hanom_Chr00s000001g01594521 [Helianthus anomalus]
MDCYTTRMDERLSGLSDDLILKILSFVSLKDAVRTSIPHLSFSSQDFSSMRKLSYPCSLSPQYSSSVVFFRSLSSWKTSPWFVFASGGKSWNSLSLSLRLSDSQTSHLKAVISTGVFVTTLHLHFITLYDGFLSMCPSLKNMTLVGCKVTGSRVLTICHPRLSNLTIDKGDCMTRIVNVVTPQLKNLTIVRYSGRFRVSAPELASLILRGPCPSRFSSTDGFPCLEKALIFIHGIEEDLSSLYTSHIISLLEQLHYVKFFSLSMEIIQVLNLSVKNEIISHQPSPLANLESLTLLPKLHFWFNDKHKRVIVSTEVKNYLLSRSPKATLTEV